MRGLRSTFLLCHCTKHTGFKQQPVIFLSLMGCWVCLHLAGSVITWRLNWAAVSKKGHSDDWLLTQLSAGLRYTPPTSAVWPFSTTRLASEKSILWTCQEEGDRNYQLSEVDLNFLRTFLLLQSLDQSSHMASLKEGRCFSGREGMCTQGIDGSHLWRHLRQSEVLACVTQMRTDVRGSPAGRQLSSCSVCICLVHLVALFWRETEAPAL